MMERDDIRRKVTRWRDNLQGNAEHARIRGDHERAQQLDTRARDMSDVLELLGGPLDIPSDTH